MSVQRVEHLVQDGLGDLGAAVDGVVAIDEDLGFNNRHDALFLAYGGVTGERFRVGFDRQPAWERGRYVVDSAPLRKTRAHRFVSGEALCEPIEALRDLVT